MGPPSQTLLLSPSADSLQICIRGNQMMALPNSRISPWLLLQVKRTSNPAVYSLQSPVWSVLCFLLCISYHHPHIPDTADWLLFACHAQLFPSQDLALLFPLPAMLFLYVLTGLLLLSLRLQPKTVPLPQPQDFPETFP